MICIPLYLDPKSQTGQPLPDPPTWKPGHVPNGFRLRVLDAIRRHRDRPKAPSSHGWWALHFLCRDLLRFSVSALCDHCGSIEYRGQRVFSVRPYPFDGLDEQIAILAAVTQCDAVEFPSSYGYKTREFRFLPKGGHQ